MGINCRTVLSLISWCFTGLFSCRNFRWHIRWACSNRSCLVWVLGGPLFSRLRRAVVSFTIWGPRWIRSGPTLIRDLCSVPSGRVRELLGCISGGLELTRRNGWVGSSLTCLTLLLERLRLFLPYSSVGRWLFFLRSVWPSVRCGPDGQLG